MSIDVAEVLAESLRWILGVTLVDEEAPAASFAPAEHAAIETVSALSGRIADLGNKVAVSEAVQLALNHFVGEVRDLVMGGIEPRFRRCPRLPLGNQSVAVSLRICGQCVPARVSLWFSHLTQAFLVLVTAELEPTGGFTPREKVTQIAPSYGFPAPPTLTTFIENCAKQHAADKSAMVAAAVEASAPLKGVGNGNYVGKSFTVPVPWDAGYLVDESLWVGSVGPTDLPAEEPKQETWRDRPPLF